LLPSVLFQNVKIEICKTINSSVLFGCETWSLAGHSFERLMHMLKNTKTNFSVAFDCVSYFDIGDIGCECYLVER
jgi:hypothetical protein